MTRSRLAGLLASGVLVLSAAVAPTSSLAADAALADCSLANTGMVDNRWEGGPSGDWSNPANWSLKAPPGQSETPDQNVCIPDDVTITLDAPGVSRVDLLAIELGRRAKLLMDPGTSLFVWGDRWTRPSLAQPGSLIYVNGATLGGDGKIEVLGTVRIASNGESLARLTTDSDLEEDYDGLAGQLVIAEGGLLDVRGTGDVLLSWGFTVELHGMARLREKAAIVADHGTRFAVATDGELRLENDRGYLEGPSRGLRQLSEFVNQGLVVKAKGTGTSTITANYGTDNFRDELGKDVQLHTRVLTGALVLPDKTWAPARVGGGATYASGICEDISRICDAGTSEQYASFQVPAGDGNGARVTVTPLKEKAPDGGLGMQFKAHAENLWATPEDPAVIELRYDQDLLYKSGRTSDPAALVVKRRAWEKGLFDALVDCPASGIIPPGEAACVDRRPGASRTLADGDVVMVVRAIETSRWIVD